MKPWSGSLWSDQTPLDPALCVQNITDFVVFLHFFCMSWWYLEVKTIKHIFFWNLGPKRKMSMYSDLQKEILYSAICLGSVGSWINMKPTAEILRAGRDYIGGHTGSVREHSMLFFVNSFGCVSPSLLSRSVVHLSSTENQLNCKENMFKIRDAIA